MAFNQNYYLTWENGELVTADTMSAFSDGVASQVLALTNGILPIILCGGNFTFNADNTINISEGYYRIANQKIQNLEIPGYFYAPAITNLKFNNNQYIVARIVINSVSQYTTIISGKVLVVDDITDQDIVLYHANDNGSGVLQIVRTNDLTQMLTASQSQSNQLIINNGETASLTLDPMYQKITIFGIAQDAKITLPNVTSGIYSIRNLSTSTIYLVPSDGYTIYGRSQYLITPNSTIKITPITANKYWIFL